MYSMAQGRLLTGLLPCRAADLFMALAQATKQLNRHVLAKGSTVGPLLMFTTCVACDHMAGLLDGFWRDLFNPVGNELVLSPRYTSWRLQGGCTSTQS